MKITIEVIRHKEQRYPTVGDWWFDKNGDLEIRVSALSDWRLESLIAVHELWEVLLCKERGISQASVDEFDMRFEKERELGDHGEEEEPGDDPKAPYRSEHCSATGVERLLASLLGIDWRGYEERLDSLNWGHFEG